MNLINKIYITLLLLCFSFTGFTQSSGNKKQKLYNGIEIPSEWPPNYSRDPRKPMPVPYLENPPKVIPVNVGRQLFVDDFLIEETNLKREFHQAEYHPSNPILKPDKPWENKSVGWFAAPFSGGVWYDSKDKLFKMWYTGGFLYSMCLATSKDGVHWEKPELDIYPGTNVVLRPQEKVRRRSIDTITVWLDNNAKDPKERYKYFATEARKRFSMIYRTSPDGINWSESKGSIPEEGDRGTVFYNPFRNKWVYSARTKWNNKRARGYREKDDPQKLFSDSDKKHLINWVAADDNDPVHTDPKYKHVPTELYNLDVAPYESLMLGQFSIWQGPENNDCAKGKLQKRCDILLGFSRDGFHFSRPDRKRFISCSWDEKNWRYGNVQSVNGGPIVVGDKLYIYFSGRAKPGLGFYDTDTLKAASKGWDADVATGLAILRRDGFASMNAEEEGGSITTRKLSFKGKYLFVNVDCPDGELKAEILDANNNLIKPYSLENCKAIKADKTSIQLSWKNEDLSKLVDEEVKIRFHLKNGKFYSFWISENKTGSSNGYVGAGGPGYTGSKDDL